MAKGWAILMNCWRSALGLNARFTSFPRKSMKPTPTTCTSSVSITKPRVVALPLSKPNGATMQTRFAWLPPGVRVSSQAGSDSPARSSRLVPSQPLRSETDALPSSERGTLRDGVAGAGEIVGDLQRPAYRVARLQFLEHGADPHIVDAALQREGVLRAIGVDFAVGRGLAAEEGHGDRVEPDHAGLIGQPPLDVARAVAAAGDLGDLDLEIDEQRLPHIGIVEHVDIGGVDIGVVDGVDRLQS